MSDENIIRIPPSQYVHVLDCNSNLTRVIEGPLTYVLQSHEKNTSGKTPQKMVQIPPRCFCVIRNPVLRDSEQNIVQDELGMVRVRHGELAVRTAETHPDPFPLYPFEVLERNIKKIPIVQPNHALRLRALRDFEDGKGAHQAGDEWLHLGPCSYIPRIEVEIVAEVKPLTIKPNTALKLRALRETKDVSGSRRIAGEEWLIREPGDYLPYVEEEVLQEVKAQILTERRALHLRASQQFTDVYAVKRSAGDEWLVTLEMSDTHIPDVFEEIVGTITAIILNSKQFCYILDPANETGKNQYGTRVLRRGELTFFLKPHEQLENGILDVLVLEEDEALLLRATENYTDEESCIRKAGERWMIYGPCDYIPPIGITIMERRRRIPLDENEGIYIRDIRSGEVRAVSGESYMLEPYEILWEMHLQPEVEDIITRQVTGETFQLPLKEGDTLKYSKTNTGNYVHDKTRMVSFRVPHNSAVQVYDYKKKANRVVFGPDRIMLQPDEQFTVVSLSGAIPKKENMIKNIALMLGPDFMSDQVVVETLDHASLALVVSYNWHFEFSKDNEEEANKIFHVKDFVGDACKTIASRIRGSVSSYTFEDFHQRSSDIIKTAVFGRRGDEVRTELRFKANTLVITSVDIKTIEPTDPKTKASLKKSVNQSIEITTEASKARAEHEASKADEHSVGLLELQKIHDAIESEKEQIKLLQLKTRNKEIQTIAEATNQALATSKAKKIEYESTVQQAELLEESRKIERQAELELIKEQNQADVSYKRALDELEVKKARELTSIETAKFQQTIDAIGKDTVIAMAKAGPEMQSRLLKGLGLKGFMIMNSSNPINLFTTASGMIKRDS